MWLRIYFNKKWCISNIKQRAKLIAGFPEITASDNDGQTNKFKGKQFPMVEMSFSGSVIYLLLCQCMHSTYFILFLISPITFNKTEFPSYLIFVYEGCVRFCLVQFGSVRHCSPLTCSMPMCWCLCVCVCVVPLRLLFALLDKNKEGRVQLIGMETKIKEGTK